MKFEERKKKTIPVIRLLRVSKSQELLGPVTGARTSQMENCRLRRGTEGIELGFFDRLRQPDDLQRKIVVDSRLCVPASQQVCLYRLQSLLKNTR